MSLESQAIEALQMILQMEDSVLEDGFDEFVKLLEIGDSLDQAIIEKLAYCRANNLTVEDLLEENKLSSSDLPNEFQELSPIKKKFLSYLLSSANKINDTIIKKGLHQRAKVRFQPLEHNEKLPAYAHAEGDSGMDVYLTDDTVVPARSVILARTGLKAVIPLGWELQVRPRSGMSLDPRYLYLFIANSPGTIDANYRNEINIILKNLGDKPIAFEKGTRIAQLVLIQVGQAIIEKIEDVNEFPTERNGGFGSTGVK